MAHAEFVTKMNALLDESEQLRQRAGQLIARAIELKVRAIEILDHPEFKELRNRGRVFRSKR